MSRAGTVSPPLALDDPRAYLNRELSWLAFARRVLALVEDRELPLLERVKFAGIVGMLHDEFFMKRVGGLKRQVRRAPDKLSLDGRTPAQELAACREEILAQTRALSRVLEGEIRPHLERAGIPLLEHDALPAEQKAALREEVSATVLPILTPLAVDAGHPFPFISNQGLNLAVQVDRGKARHRFVRIKVPTNRPRWVPVPGSSGFVPLEQVIAANLDLVIPGATAWRTSLFRVTRGADGDAPAGDLVEDDTPGSLLRQVASELKARRFAGVVRLKVGADMPEVLRAWLAAQLGIGPEDVYPTDTLLGLSDLASFRVEGHDALRARPHEPEVPARLRDLPAEPGAFFDEVRRRDLLLHHPYDSFDGSVLRFLRAAAEDPDVLAIKLTIYRTSSDSPIVRALVDACRRGKQVAVLVEITARFDEAPNIAWGQLLEREGAHVSYGVEKLKTHVKLALVVREERGQVRRYVHVGTGNYHTGTARLYEDLGLLTADPDLCADVAAVFNQLTGASPAVRHRKLLAAPQALRARLLDLVAREAEHARAGRPSAVRAKMNQLQDPEIIRALYAASRDGVPVTLLVRGLCCLRPGVPGLSESIRVVSVVGRFLEHSRIYAFANGGSPEYFIGSADWMKRNLDRRVETVVPVEDPDAVARLEGIFAVYEADNASAWDGGPDGVYVRRRPAPGQPRRAAQEEFMRLAAGGPATSPAAPPRPPRRGA